MENKSINWYPGHMAKTKREILGIISTIDIVLEIVDARIPKSSHIIDIKDFTKDKQVIIIFNKYDLCDKAETLKWKEYYENNGYIVCNCDANNASDIKNIIKTIENLMKSKNRERFNKGLLPKKAKALVVGAPNVGKSTLINRLVNRKVAEVGNKPGVTKSLKFIRINDKIDLIDSPGVLYPKIEDMETALNLSSMNIIKEEIIPIDKVAIHILDKLSMHYNNILYKEFGINKFDIETGYEDINNYKKISKLNDEIDYDKINLFIINLIKSERIKEITFDRM
jgi:ribosome biogenesis GTPase A